MKRLDMVAVGWGALVAAVGLMAFSGRDMALRLLGTAATFLVGGFLAGVRASVARPAHGVAAGVVAHAVFAVFVALTGLVSLFTGPDPLDLLHAGAGRTGLASLWAVAFALIGGLLAGSWLRPAGRTRHGSAPRRLERSSRD